MGINPKWTDWAYANYKYIDVKYYIQVLIYLDVQLAQYVLQIKYDFPVKTKMNINI